MAHLINREYNHRQYATGNILHLILCFQQRTHFHGHGRRVERLCSRAKGPTRLDYTARCSGKHTLPISSVSLGILLVVFSTLIHWLISQSLFLVSVQAYSPSRERDPNQDLTSCGFPPIAVVASISVGAVMVSYLIGMGLRKFRSGKPVARSNSLAMSTACHPYPLMDDCDEDREGFRPEYRPLKLGAVHLEGRLFDEAENPKDGELYR